MIGPLPPLHIYLHDVQRENFALYRKVKRSSAALSVDRIHSAGLNCVAHEAVQPWHIDMHACYKLDGSDVTGDICRSEFNV